MITQPMQCERCLLSACIRLGGSSSLCVFKRIADGHKRELAKTERNRDWLVQGGRLACDESTGAGVHAQKVAQTLKSGQDSPLGVGSLVARLL